MQVNSGLLKEETVSLWPNLICDSHEVLSGAKKNHSTLGAYSILPFLPGTMPSQVVESWKSLKPDASRMQEIVQE